MDQPDLLVRVRLAEGANGGSGDGMVTTDDDRQERLGLREDASKALLDVDDALAQVEDGSCDVPDLPHFQVREVDVVVGRIGRVDRPRLFDRVRSAVRAIREDRGLAGRNADKADVELRLPVPRLDPVIDPPLVRIIPVQPLPELWNHQVRDVARWLRLFVEVAHMSSDAYVVADRDRPFDPVTSRSGCGPLIRTRLVRRNNVHTASAARIRSPERISATRLACSSITGSNWWTTRSTSSRMSVRNSPVWVSDIR